MAPMRTETRSAASLATDRVTKAFIEAANAGTELPFPDGSEVIPSDLATDERICEAHASGYTVARGYQKTFGEQGGSMGVPLLSARF